MGTPTPREKSILYKKTSPAGKDPCGFKLRNRGALGDAWCGSARLYGEGFYADAFRAPKIAIIGSTELRPSQGLCMVGVKL